MTLKRLIKDKKELLIRLFYIVCLIFVIVGVVATTILIGYKNNKSWEGFYLAIATSIITYLNFAWLGLRVIWFWWSELKKVKKTFKIIKEETEVIKNMAKKTKTKASKEVSEAGKVKPLTINGNAFKYTVTEKGEITITPNVEFKSTKDFYNKIAADLGVFLETYRKQ